MKKTLLLALATLFASATFAQQQLATLNHNDSVSVFYGASALQQAHAAAVNGDIIILSSGSFNSVNITKAITIRGNGMEENLVAGISPTIINGDFALNITNDNTNHLRMEGLKMTGTVYRRALTSPYFYKCRFNTFRSYSNPSMVGTMHNAIYTNCVFDFIQGGNDFQAYNTQYINCVILKNNDYGQVNCTLRNCIADMNINYLQYYYSVTCINCILYLKNANSSGLNSSTSNCYSCIGINARTNISDQYFADTNHYNHNLNGLTDVFKYFNGTYYDGVSFELQDSIAANVLGNDGTQVGVYGGMVPFNPRVNTPRYVNCSVAPHTTLDGKLSVDIEVVSE